MTKNDICITIPIYKETLDSFEIQSINRCIEILSQYSIYFVCSKTLNTSFYKAHFQDIKKYMFFDKQYFESLRGYNQLLLNINYYEVFSKYEYMLVYQTDCYVFKDELLYWASKNFDYIGGVWFKNFHNYNNNKPKLWFPGNGGFSLRKISTFIKVLNSKKRLKNYSQLEEEKKKLGKTKGLKSFKNSILFFLKFFGYKNSVSFYAKHFDNNEDVFFSNLCMEYHMLKVPKVSDALLFSWDSNPEYLYQQLNQLPFGSHAWFRDDKPYENNRAFWLNIINKAPKNVT